MGLTANSPVASGWRDTLLSISTAVIAGAAILGVILVKCELDQLQRQNTTLEETMRAAFRPVGVATYSKDLGQKQVKLTYIPSSKPLKLSFVTNHFLYNQGKGVLSYFGHVYYISKEEIDFRENFLAGLLDGVEPDELAPVSRGMPIQPNDYAELRTRWVDVDFEQEYFLNILFIYSDQEGNLYDTEHVAYIAFGEKPKVALDAIEPKLVAGFYKEMYHYYPPETEQILTRRIAGLNPSFADVLRAGR